MSIISYVELSKIVKIAIEYRARTDSLIESSSRDTRLQSSQSHPYH